MRRLASVAGLVVLGIAFVVLLPLWLPIALVVDLVTAPRRLPHTRLLAFGLWWSWLEIIGLAVCGWLFVTGRTHRPAPHYALQRWWANGLVVGLRATCRLHVEPRGLEALTSGPVVVLPRHTSFADALLSAWLVTQRGLQPRYVLKRELLADPCLDVVGNRLPNHFLDRQAADTRPELAALLELAAGAMGPHDAVVIFPEGTRANPEKRAQGLARLAERNPTRAAKLGALAHLIPPRPAGTLAVLAGASTADVVFVAHAGFEGLDTFGGILRAIPGPAPVVVECTRVARADVPDGDAARTAWLDDEWLRLDERVERLMRDRAALAGAAVPR
jgi:1-acyl-sn-glycerol-3-phosphate acyltransferase